MNQCYFCQNELQRVSNQHYAGIANCRKCCLDNKIEYAKSFYENNKIDHCIITDLKISVHLLFRKNITICCYFAGAEIVSFPGFPITPTNFHLKKKTILTFQ
jgi:hypothetical protein